MKSFREVITDIKMGQTWSDGIFEITLCKEGDIEEILDIVAIEKGYFKQNLAGICFTNKKDFKLKGKDYTFAKDMKVEKRKTEVLYALECEEAALEEESNFLLKNDIKCDLVVGKLLGIKRAIEVVKDLI